MNSNTLFGENESLQIGKEKGRDIYKTGLTFP